jgi:hypothetical protein
LRELIWPNTFVVAGNLTVNIAALRRALRDGVGGNRYIVNVTGRGYYFVAPVTFEDAVTTRARQHPAIIPQQSLSAHLKGPCDLAGDIGKAVAPLPTIRILGGIESGDGAKTFVLLAVAEEPRPACALGKAN